jgi:hypothetical protein
VAGFAAAEAALAAAAGALDEVYDPIGARHEVAFQRLLRTPAPDAAAPAYKLELASQWPARRRSSLPGGRGQVLVRQ